VLNSWLIDDSQNRFSVNFSRISFCCSAEVYILLGTRPMSSPDFFRFHIFAPKQLKYRMISVYLIPILLFCGTAWIVDRNSQTVQVKHYEFEAANDRLDQVKKLDVYLTGMQRSALGYMIGQAPSDLTAFENWDDRFYAQAEKLRGIIQEPRQREQLSKIIQLGDQNGEFDRRLISYIELGNPDKAIETWKKGNRQQIIKQLEQLIAEFEVIAQEEINVQQAEEQFALRSLRWIVFGSTCLAGGVAIALGLKVAGSIANQMNQEATAVATSAQEIAATIEEQARTSALQASSVNETTATMDELNASARKMSEQAQGSACSASAVLDLTDQGSQAMQRSLEEMTTLQQKVEAIADQIQELNQQASQIRQITSLVSDLANQTNMLALNASVEAVRAGEHGKGFGVVATNIRQLADQSRASSKKIDRLISEIQTTIKSTVTVSEDGQKIVATSLQIAEETAGAFNGVRTAINDMAHHTEQISLATNQQSSAIEQVVNAMQDLNIAAQETTAGINQVQMATHNLSDAAQN
jgi:methyl-accepting chemotaxis protein